MDFGSDALFDGRRLRALTLLDVFTREALAIELDKGITGEQVVAILDAVIAIRAAAQGYHRALSQCAMAPSLPQTHSNAGPTNVTSHSTSADRASRRQCIRGILQRTAARGMSERSLALVSK